MKIITVDANNIENEHICCAIANAKDIQVKSKKEWMLEQFENGLVFKKIDVRGKCFIEYLPLENAWVPVVGENLMYINCMWVAGKFQGLGYAYELLQACINDCKDKSRDGLVILCAKKKMSFLMDYDFLVKHGFVSVDTLAGYELMFLSLNEKSARPQFKIRKMNLKDEGLVLYYSYQCPFCAKYVPILEEYCRENNIHFKTIQLKNSLEAQNAPTIFTTYSLFYNHEFITKEILSIKKFEKILEKLK